MNDCKTLDVSLHLALLVLASQIPAEKVMIIPPEPPKLTLMESYPKRVGNGKRKRNPERWK
jgi:hypothetical protein